MGRRKSEPHPAFVASVVCAAVLTMLLEAGAGAPGRTPADAAEARRQQIEQMSVVDRERLIRKFKTFLSLSESRRAAYRELYRELEKDAQAGGNLRQVMHAYYDWLTTLSPWQREELRKAADHSKKMELIRTFKHEQKVKQAGPRRVYPGSLGPHLGRFLGYGRRLSSEDLAGVMQVVEHSVPLSRDRRRELDKHEGLNRYLMTLEAVLEHDAALGRPLAAPWPSEPLMEKMLAAVGDEKVRERLAAIPEPASRRRELVKLIIATLVAELHAEAQRHKPEEKEINKFFVQLDDVRRDEIMRLPTDQAQRRLALLYALKHHDEFPVDTKKMWKVTDELSGRAGLRRPGGPGRRYPGGRRFGPPGGSFPRRGGDAARGRRGKGE